MTDERYAYHLLHEEAHGRSLVQRLNDKQVSVNIPGGWAVMLPVDVRDKRTLVVFDGFIIFGGLPKNVSVVAVEDLSDLEVNADQVSGEVNMQQLADFFEHEHFVVPCVYRFDDLENGYLCAYARHRRYFLLLPSCRAVVFRYRPKSLSPQGVVIEVKDGRAEFKTTSY